MNEDGYARAIADARVLPQLDWRVRISDRRRSIGLTAEPRGGLTISVPHGARPSEVINAVRSGLPWVVRNTHRQLQIAADHPAKEIVDGENFPYLGRSRRLVLIRSHDQAVRVEGDRLLAVEQSAEQVAAAIVGWYQANGGEWLTDRVPYWAKRLGVNPAHTKVGHLKGKWGLRRSDGGVVLHWALFQLPTRYADLTLVHELAHLIEPHHGPRFQRLVTQMLPDHRDRTEELAQAGRSLWLGDIAPHAHRT